MSKQRKTILRRKVAGVDTKLLIKDAGKLLPEPSRRLFLRGATSLGALAMLTGCDIVDSDTSENALRAVSRFNDWVQARLFNPHTLAPEFPEEEELAGELGKAVANVAHVLKLSAGLVPRPWSHG